MIEFVTINGFRRAVQPEQIASVSEIGKGRSNSVVTLNNGEVLFVANTYDDIMNAYNRMTVGLPIIQDPPPVHPEDVDFNE